MLKHSVQWRDLSEGQETGNVGLIDLDDSTVFIKSVLCFDAVDDQGDTGIIWVVFIGGEVDSSYQI